MTELPIHKAKRMLKATLTITLIFVSIFAIALILGEDQERKAWVSAPLTLQLYETEETCQDEAGSILNCGRCGSCSNLNDIGIYYQTRETLTTTMTHCGIGDLLFRQNALDCLQDNVGLTNDCAQCWVTNYKCTAKRCFNTCFKHRFLPMLPSLNSWDSGPLDPCFACDERLCGPEFLSCAGANRRRVGVVSDIERDINMICKKVDWEWILSANDLPY